MGGRFIPWPLRLRWGITFGQNQGVDILLWAVEFSVRRDGDGCDGRMNGLKEIVYYLAG